MSTEKIINEETNPACFLGAVMPSFLIHPYAQVVCTNKDRKSTRLNSSH